ncbi:MAG: hypothetical protein IID03_10975 [Candidatus Dadabacteria bacterium]|nr:hypothetical protein [Candidatus Dadabacteria bacterium]
MFQNILKKFGNIDFYNLALRLTLLDLILRPIGSWEIRVPVLITSILGLVIPGLLKNPAIWFLLTGFTLSRVIFDWPLSDNHAYLLFLWCFAIFISALKKDKILLTKNARLMIGLVFLFAFIWKAFLSPDFLDKRFFSVNMIEDPRFSEFTQVTCNISKDDLDYFRDYVKQHVDGNLVFAEVINFNLKCINKIAGFLTYYTIVLELLIALFFLIPKKISISKYRDYFLILFCISVYSVATVEGFGWLLIAMGISQSDNKKLPILLYILSFFIILFYREVPILNIVLEQF